MEQGVYPLLLDGERTGEVSVSVEGAWTVFSVTSEMRPGVIRVSVYGGEREGYLGVLAPEGEGLSLRRRLSRSALRDFPAQITYAARAGQPCKQTEPEAETAPEAPEAEPEPAKKSAPPEEKEEAPPGMEDLYWYASPDGALVCFDGTENLIALPPDDPRRPAGGGGWPKTIEGRDYVVYRTRDGRLLR